MPQNGNFFKKYQLLALFGVLEVKFQILAVLRHLEGFWEKSDGLQKYASPLSYLFFCKPVQGHCVAFTDDDNSIIPYHLCEINL